MMQVNDFICDVCGGSCSEATVPLVAYLVLGQPSESQKKDGPFDLNAPGIYVPAIVRELMAQPVARREWCVKCFAKAFGLALIEAPQPEGKVAEAP